jgi:hypothetical protein
LCLNSIVAEHLDGPDDEVLKKLREKIHFPLKHVLLPRSDPIEPPQALAVVINRQIGGTRMVFS